jgi:DNA-binding LacI/PurR family transcriptional regulator
VSRPARLEDVARRAGVHPSTVSRVISRPGIVAPATRDRVEAAIRELDYVPNRLAQGLAQGRNQAIGVLVPDVANPYFAAIVQAAQDEARTHDFVVVLVDTRHDPDEEVRAIATLRAQVDGLIACSPVAPANTPPGIPLVYVNRRTSRVHSVTVDQGRIVALGVEHLVALGHRHIAVLNGPRSYWSSVQRSVAIRRLAAQHERAKIRLVELPDLDPTFDGGAKATDAALATGATAVCAFNDVMALGVVATVTGAGLRVPGDVSVVGSDGIDIAAMSWPPLTTVSIPLAELGRCAVRALLAKAGRRRAPRHTELQPTLIVRESTGPRGAR